MNEERPQTESPVARLCSEVQLFDLCDLDRCSHKNGRFCTNEQLLKKFEAIREEDERHTLLYDESELEDDDEADFDEYGDDYEEDE